MAHGCTFRDMNGFDGIPIRIERGILLIKFCTFSNIYGAGDGGAIYTESSENRLLNSRFIKCNSTLSGGAILARSTNHTVIQDCSFSRCSSVRGAACWLDILMDKTNGVESLKNPKNISVTGCQFKDCVSIKSDRPGDDDYYCTLAVDFESTKTVSAFNLTECSFTQNKGFGVLSEASYMNIKNTVFSELVSGIQGHASCVHCLGDSINFGSYLLYNVTFTGCSTQDFGVMNVPNVALNMSYCTVSYCTAIDSDEHKDAHGFMITDYDNQFDKCNISYCNFVSNEGNNGGAGIYIDRRNKDILIEYCNFDYNTASYAANSVNYGANLQVMYEGTINVEFCKFNYYKANDAASVLFKGVSRVTFRGNCFYSNGWRKFQSAFHLVSDYPITILDPQCFNNMTEFGPLFNLHKDQDTKYLNTNCDTSCHPKSECPKDGSRIIDDPLGVVYLTSCDFDNYLYTKNDEEEGGGVISLFGSKLILKSCKFTNDSATLVAGGAIYTYLSEVTMNDCSFARCKSDIQCGAFFYLYPRKCEMYNVVLDNCDSPKISAGKITFSSTSLSTNLITLNKLTVKNTDFQEKNVGTDHDCCFAIDYFNDWDDDNDDENDDIMSVGLNATLIDCSFIDNNRFALLLEVTNFTLINAYFNNIVYSDVKQQNHSCCIHCITQSIESGQYDLINSTFYDIQTNDFGAMNVPNVGVYMYGCSLKKCTAFDKQAKDGHGISFTDNDYVQQEVLVIKCEFINVLTNSGGAIFIDRADKDITIKDCTFNSNAVLYNISPYNGANIMAVGAGTIKLDGCVFNYYYQENVPSTSFENLSRVVIKGCCFNTFGTEETSPKGVHIHSNINITFMENNCYTKAPNAFVCLNNPLPGPPYLNTNCKNCEPVIDCNEGERKNFANAQIFLLKCKFRGLGVTGQEGGVITAIECTIKIDSCGFIRNSAMSGSSGYFHGCILKVLDCVIISEINKYNGAFAVHYPISTLFFNTNFSLCTSSSTTCIRIMFTPDYDPDNDDEEIPQTANITKCVFKDSTLTQSDKEDDYKCAIGFDAEGESTVMNGFILNSTIQNMNAFGVLSELSYLTVENTVFDNIEAKLQGHAAAIHCLPKSVHFGSYKLYNVSFTSCITQDFGVMNVPNVRLDMRYCLVKDCFSYDEDEHKRAHGFMITDDDDQLMKISIYYCEFSNNEAANGGAGLYIDRKEKDVDLMNCVFRYNQATYDDESDKYGANLQVMFSGKIYIAKCEFTFDKINKASSVWFDRLDRITMTQCCFKSTGKNVDNSVFHIVSTSEIFFDVYTCFNDMKNNFIFTRGQDQENIKFNCKDICVPNNECPKKRIENNIGRLVLSQCTFENIVTAGDGLSGGIIKVSTGELIVDSCLFTKISATGKDATGGAIRADSSRNEIRNSKFIKCESKLFGGALFLMTPNYVKLSNNIFSYCKSRRTSAVMIQYAEYFIINPLIESCTFKDCSCIDIDDTDYYCALSLDFNQWKAVQNATINNCKFVDIKSFAILLEASYLNLTNTVFQNCVCDQQNLCSCVYVQIMSVRKGKYIICNTSFIECKTEDYGIINIPNVELNMRDCQVLRCTSTDSDNHVDAHGVMITDNDPSTYQSYIVNCLFQENVAGNGGAGLFIDRKSPTITIDSCKFIKNQVTYAKDSAKYGANLQIQQNNMNPGANPEYPNIWINYCKFVFDKVNDESNLMILNTMGLFLINGSCFVSNGEGKTPFHIVSKANINFEETNCFNDKGEYNFGFVEGQVNGTFNFNCAENCLPQSNCPIMFRYPNSTGVTVNIVNCQIRAVSVSGEDGNNGGVFYLKKCKFYLIDSGIQECSAPKGSGGAIYADNTVMEVINTKFISCSANSLGGAINSLVSPYGILVQDCTFIRCNSSKVSSLRVSVPEDNKENDYIDDPFVATIINCMFKENYASFEHDYYCSVCIECFFDLTISTVMKGCKFINMNNYGMFSANSYFTLEDTIFENLNATINKNFASAIHCNTYKVSYGEYTIKNTTFIKCSSDDFGVMNVPNIGLKMTNVLVKDCKSFDSDEHKNAHGFMITDNDDQLYPIMIENCVFESNDGANGGGGLYIDRKRKDITICNCQFLNNVASYNPNSKDYGCNLQVVGSGKINLTKCKFVSSKQQSNDASSIRFENLTRITIIDCCFKSNGYKENSTYYITSNTNITFIGVQCITNKSGQHQILFNFAEGQKQPELDSKCDEFCIPNMTCPYNKRTSNVKLLVNINDCYFNDIDVQGLGNGGALYCSSCVVYIRGSGFQNCRTTSMSTSGGAIYCIRSEMHLIKTKFAACQAYTYGGAVESVFPNVTEIQSCQFVRCTAMRASALHINITPEYNPDDDEFEVPQVATIIGCTFRDNYHIKSTGEGYEDYYCSVSVDFDLEFTNLNATFKDTQFIDSKEFAILSEATTLHMENVVFRGIKNDVQGHASCVHCLPKSIHLGTYIIKNTSFIDCLTEDFGVMNVPNVGLNMTDCVVLRCNSTDSDKHTEAHGFMITDDDDLLFPVYIYNCVFESNDGANGGAGLYIDRKQKNIVIEKCKFVNNKASYNAKSENYGVNLQAEGTGKISITKCKFIYNKQNNAASVRFQGLDEIILNNNCFISNGIGNTPFHIYSNTIITFEGSQHCFNQKGNYNFQLPTGQKIPDTVKFTCDEHCVPEDTCPTKSQTSNNAVVNIFKCKFSGIKSTYNGGVISSRDGIVYIIETSFNDCSAKSTGGAAYISSGEAHIYGSSFTNCACDQYTGGLHIIDPNVTEIQACSFTNCQAKRVSALYVSFKPDYVEGNDEEEIPQYAYVINCQFSNCKNTKAEGYYLDYYCTVSLDFQDDATVVNSTVMNCSFTDNTGFGILSELTYFQLINTVFTRQNNDKAQNHSSCVHCLTETVHFGEYTIINSSFIECSTDDYGVMNVPNVKLTLKDSLVSKCTTTDSDTHINAHGFMITDDDDLLEQIQVTNCVFSDNNCANGGALYINRKLKDILIDSCTFTNNKATYIENSDKYGASLQVEGSGNIRLNECKFEYEKVNKATSVRFEGLDTIQMGRCCFKTKATSKDGYFNIWADKRIAFVNYMCFNTIDGVSNDKLNYFTGNQNTEQFSYNCDEYCIPLNECPSGGGPSQFGGTINIRGCNFVDTNPGIIQIVMGRVIIRDSVFKPKQLDENKVPASAVISRLSDIYIYNTVFEKCKTGSDAGAIIGMMANITVIEGCRFSECSNKLVSAIYLDMIADTDASNDMTEIPKLANFTGCTFTKCSHPDYDPEKAKFYCTLAVNTGSVVSVVEFNLISCTFEDIQGFGVLSTASFMTMKDTTFKNITHDKQNFASCVHVPPDYVHFGTYTITNTKFLNCMTQDYGVMNVPNVGLHMISCTISNCVALDSDQSTNGHGFMITDDDDLLYPVVIDSCTFEGNDGANGGAGLYIDRKQKSVFISNCQFRNNKASHDAGSNNYGVNIQVIGSGVIKMSKCQFDFQKTNQASSLRFNLLDQIVIDSCNFNSEGVSGSPYHIVADTLITFEGVSCLNNKGEFNFKFADGQATTGISFTCSGGGGGDDSQNQGSGSGVSPGGMAGIIIAVVAIIAVAAVAVIVFMIKKGMFGRKEDSDVYHADKEVSYSEAMSTATFETANAEHVFDDEL